MPPQVDLARRNPSLRTMDLTPFIRDVPNFPKPGITFKDITPLIGNAAALAYSIDRLAEAVAGLNITCVVGIESRGFIIAPPVALRLGVGFVPVRKPGKLPWKARKQTYQLEYGTDSIEIHEDALTSQDRVLVVDDVLATGGTASAAVSLVNGCGATVVAAAFLIELSFLGGAKRLSCPIISVVRY